MKNKEPYTVYAVFEKDNSQRYTAYVDAMSPEDAEKRAAKDANTPIIIAGVVKGYIAPVDAAGRKDVTPLHGRGYETWVSKLTTTSERFRVPFHCPRCRTDLRRADSLKQTDYPVRIWDARLPRGTGPSDHWGAVINEDQGAVVTDAEHYVLAVRLACACCGAIIWNGYRNDGPDHCPAKKTRRS